MAEIVWSPSSVKDINAIAEYFAKDSLMAAKNKIALFFQKAEILSPFPHYGKQVPETKNSFLREILFGRYRIIYEVFSEDQVNIHTVHHQSRLLKNNPSIKKKIK